MGLATTNKTLIVTRPGDDQVMLVVAIILDPESLDIERLLSGLVPEMARGGVPAGLLVVGDSTLVLRHHDQQIHVDEVDTTQLLSLAGIDDPWGKETITLAMRQWLCVMAGGWRDRIIGPIREILVPHVVAGLAGDIEEAEGIWGLESHRLVQPQEV